MATAEMAGTGVEEGEDGAGWVYLALMILIGSTTATAAKYSVHELPAAFLPLVRFGGAGLCLLPLVGVAALARMAREDGGRLLAASACCVPINQAFFLNGTKLTTTTHVGLIYAACPLVVLALACVLGQERLTRDRLAGVLASVVGVAVIGLGSLRQHRGPGGAWAFWGDLLEVGAVTSWGAYLTVNKPLVARHGALAAIVGTFLVGSVLQLPVALATMPGWPSLSAASPMAWRGLAFLTLVVGVLGLPCQNQALRRFDASQVAAVGNLAPLLTIVWGVLLHGEGITSTLVVGGVLTLGGVVWASAPARRPAPAFSEV